LHNILNFDVIVIKLYMNCEEVQTMAYIISEDCISCGACAAQCPVSCISEGDEKYVIDESACVDCGSCADACPVSAAKQA
jgi:ferredoxin